MSHIYWNQVLNKFSPLNGYGPLLFLNGKIILKPDQEKRGRGERRDTYSFSTNVSLFFTHTLVVTGHVTTAVEAHLHSRATHWEKASARWSYVVHGQKDYIAAGRRLASRLFGAHYPSLSLQDSFQTPPSCSPSATTAEEVSRSLTDLAPSLQGK